jgi:hypothetical protein
VIVGFAAVDGYIVLPGTRARERRQWNSGADRHPKAASQHSVGLH